jgi:hypothetical protein
MTWHFDASSSKASQDLIIFLRWPYYSEVRRILQIIKSCDALEDEASKCQVISASIKTVP